MEQAFELFARYAPQFPCLAAGIAQSDGFGSFTAMVAEVSVKDGQIKVHRVVFAIDSVPAILAVGQTMVIVAAGIEYIQGAIERSPGVSVSIVHRMNGSATGPCAPCSLAVISGIEMIIAMSAA